MTQRQYCVLVVDDEAGIRHGLQRLFEKAGYFVHVASSSTEAIREAERERIDIAIVDVRLKNSESGIDLISELKVIEPDMIVLIVTGYGSIDTAVAAMKQGAAEYVVKPIDNIKLLDSVSKNIQLRVLKEENRFLRSELSTRHSPQFISRNAQILSVLAKADKIKNTAVTALITGESGTGKEVLARYIHSTSNRSEARFVSINCAALSESLLLSELFGHEKGSFTGAIERKSGKFEIADGGTLFLDEIGDMPIEIQSKLLRVLEESAFERVGGNRRITVDVRILAATNQNLPSLIAAGRFREDLFYRINVVSFSLPPLRERLDDIELLVDHFLRKYNLKYKKNIESLAPAAIRSLQEFRWPGNVRELENVINQAVLLSEGPEIEKLPGDMGEAAQKALLSHHDTPTVRFAGTPANSLKEFIETLVEQQERQYLSQVLSSCGNNKSLAARTLRVTRKTLARKMMKYGLS